MAQVQENQDQIVEAAVAVGRRICNISSAMICSSIVHIGDNITSLVAFDIEGKYCRRLCKTRIMLQSKGQGCNV